MNFIFNSLSNVKNFLFNIKTNEFHEFGQFLTQNVLKGDSEPRQSFADKPKTD